MENQLEYFDVLANTQKQVFNNLLSAQKDLRVQWMDAIAKTHTTFTTIPGLPETAQTKEALNQYNTWFNTAVSSSKTAADEALKTQENWISAYATQVETNREAFKSFIDLTKSTTTAVKTKVVA